MMQPIQDYEGADNGPAISARAARRPACTCLSAADHDLYTRAFDAADRGDWIGGARARRARAMTAPRTRLIDWRYVLDKNSGASFAEIDAFLKANPDWPAARHAVLARAETALDPNMTPAQVIAWFGNRAPVSGIGKVRLGDAMIATGQTAPPAATWSATAGSTAASSRSRNSPSSRRTARADHAGRSTASG